MVVTSAIEMAPELSIVMADAAASAVLPGYSSQTEQLAQADQYKTGVPDRRKLDIDAFIEKYRG